MSNISGVGAGATGGVAWFGRFASSCVAGAELVAAVLQPDVVLERGSRYFERCAGSCRGSFSVPDP